MSPTALFLLVLIPFIGAAFAALMSAAKVARTWAVLIGFVTFVLSLCVALSDGNGPVRWGYWANNTLELREIGFTVKLACDGISAWLLLLNTLLFPLVVLSVGRDVDTTGNKGANTSGYYAWLLVLLGAINGCFVAGDGLLFYFFFELTLVPCLLLIGVWGGPLRRKAAAKFFIYTFAGSIFLLIGLIYLGVRAGTFEIGPMIAAAQDPNVVSPHARVWLGLAFLVGFLVKTPVFPLHTWQAQTYEQSPTSTTVILAAVMSKLGTYGLLRLTLPIGFVNAGPSPVTEWVVALCLASVVYAGLIAWVQKDLARVMAFSSISHLGVCVLALFGLNQIGMQGAVAYMLAHGLSTAALFFLIGMIADRTGTRRLDEMSGLFKAMPIAGTLLVLFVMASIGLPITSGFVGEFLSLLGVTTAFGLGIGAVATLGVILGAVYMLNVVAKIGFGPLTAPKGADLRDLNGRDLLILAPLAVAVVLLGVVPTPVLDSIKRDVAMIRTATPGGPMAASVTEGPAQTEAAAFATK